jgi:membrane protein DedA with SNARE-associated domain
LNRSSSHPIPVDHRGAGAILIPSGSFHPERFPPDPLVIVLPGTIASTLGSFIGYVISFYGGKALVIRLQRFLDVDWNQIENLEKRFQGKREALSIFLSRAIPVFPISLVSILAGLLRIPIRPFVLYTFLGSISMSLPCFFGWWIERLRKVASRLDSVETIVSILMLIGMGAALSIFIKI